MKKIGHLLKKPVRTAPDVWVRRLVILENRKRGGRFIQDIKFQKGLNIVWAEEPEPNDSEAEISGHSAGKTTLCRFLRYVLGETTFGTKKNMRQLAAVFPDGYVGAEIVGNDGWWAVIRPFKKGRYSYIKPDDSLEGLLEGGGQQAFEADYSQKLGLEDLLDGLPSGTIIQSQQHIVWQHLLAWCTRDQEARFQDVHGWRSSKSESDWPAFRFPKSDALFLIRATLGLFSEKELRIEEELGRLARQRDELETMKKGLAVEPDFRVRLYGEELRKRLRRYLGERPEINTAPFQQEDSLGLFPNLEAMYFEARGKLNQEVEDLKLDLDLLQQEIDGLGADVSPLENSVRILKNTLRLLTETGDEETTGSQERENIRKNIQEHKDHTCYFGNVLFGQCEHIRAREEALRACEIEDAHTVEQHEARRAEEVEKLRNQISGLEKRCEELAEEKRAKTKIRDGFAAQRREKETELQSFKEVFDQLSHWREQRLKPTEFKELVECQESLDSVNEKIHALEAELSRLLERHHSNQKLLQQIFSEAVKGVLRSGTYDGRVTFRDRLLEFSITHGASMSGEAVETLAVLLADVATMAYTAVSKDSRFPGLLLHDSPREADLSLRLFWSYLRFVASLQEVFGDRETCPFQYIVTTTTPPPQELRGSDWVRLKLDASRESGLLLKRNVALPESIDAMTPGDPQLRFDEENPNW